MILVSEEIKFIQTFAGDQRQWGH